jgi:putative sterol carrier protein
MYSLPAMEERRRRRVLRSAAEVPVALVEEIVDDMAARMSGTPEARACVGLSFTYVLEGRRLPRYRYEIGADGAVSLTRDDASASTFTFSGDSDTFDSVLRGQSNALKALLTGHVRLHGSLWHVRGLLRMMPAVERAYSLSRDAMVRRHEDRYDFRF